MSKIKILARDQVQLIAAGEVISSYKSLLKELIENSIDAGATRIYVTFLPHIIKVQDNGEGMDLEDLLLCTKNHSTSKIYSIEDLNNLSSLGFRGEALYSIKSVSKMKISSRGFCFNDLLLPGAINEGTLVEIRDLFYNLPVRKDYLQFKTNEIKTMILEYSLFYNDIEFILTTSNKEYIFGGSKEERIEKYFNNNFHYEFRSGNRADFYLYMSFKAKNKQIIFVNGRPIIDKKISGLVKLINFHKTGQKEVDFCLFIKCNPSYLDVNIHPSKSEIKFVFDIYKEFFNVFSWEVSKNLLKKNNCLQEESLLLPPYYTYVGMISNRYLLFLQSNELVIMDQHAAHERIVAEKLKSKNFLMEKLINPIVLWINNNVAATLEEMEEYFEIEKLDNKIIILSVPSFLKETQLNKFIQSMKESFFSSRSLLDYFYEYGCKNSIKSGDYLQPEEAISLLESLCSNPNFHFCNHGRPTFIKFELEKIDQLFNTRSKRI